MRKTDPAIGNWEKCWAGKEGALVSSNQATMPEIHDDRLLNNNISIRGAPCSVANLLIGQQIGAISWRPVLAPFLEDQPIPD